jgi:hypothetical protein
MCGVLINEMNAKDWILILCNKVVLFPVIGLGSISCNRAGHVRVCLNSTYSGSFLKHLRPHLFEMS